MPKVFIERQPKSRQATTYPQLPLFAGDTPNTIVNRFACPQCGAISQQLPVSGVQQELLTVRMVTCMHDRVLVLCSHCNNRYRMVILQQVDEDAPSGQTTDEAI